jgi:hypothetical protein
VAWTKFEKDLFQLSGGAYDPREQAARRRVRVPHGASGTGVGLEVHGRVSVVSPTMCSRQRYHEQLWNCFVEQDWPDKELIVVESYVTQPSAFLQAKALEDHRLVHVCLQRGSDDDEDDFSVGLKRSMTLHLASGEYVVNFDDDDIYAGTYVTKMVSEMRSRGLVAITLGTWYNYLVSTGEVGYSDPRVEWFVPPETMDQEEMDEVVYGYGFSYAHRRNVALALPYPDATFAEDAPFFLRLRAVYGRDRVVAKSDLEGICMHLVHKMNSAGAMPIVGTLNHEEIATLDVAPLFQMYLEKQASLLLPQVRAVVAKLDLAATQALEDVWGLFVPKVACVSKHRRIKSL